VNIDSDSAPRLDELDACALTGLDPRELRYALHAAVTRGEHEDFDYRRNDHRPVIAGPHGARYRRDLVLAILPMRAASIWFRRDKVMHELHARLPCKYKHGERVVHVYVDEVAPRTRCGTVATYATYWGALDAPLTCLSCIGLGVAPVAPVEIIEQWHLPPRAQGKR
jgi:hypothetical protein